MVEKLKTLKDFLKGRQFIENNEDREIITFGELRAEAVKWVKEIRKGDDLFWQYETNCCCFIKHFFNLTEDDLN